MWPVMSFDFGASCKSPLFRLWRYFGLMKLVNEVTKMIWFVFRWTGSKPEPEHERGFWFDRFISLPNLSDTIRFVTVCINKKNWWSLFLSSHCASSLWFENNGGILLQFFFVIPVQTNWTNNKRTLWKPSILFVKQFKQKTKPQNSD